MIMTYPYPSSPMWLEGTKLVQSVVGADWLVYMEGAIIEEKSTIVAFKRNLFGVKKPYKKPKYVPGYLEHDQDGNLMYADEEGNLRKITKETKPSVRISKKPVPIGVDSSWRM